ncbi:hypothetical protein V6N11_028815 [Hibiscus sabdariffa]|uniref:Uncharacterized protein n=1 Tax=Hibiscus sabdariffa TaxID=183260 RepID=A0ABR2PRI3_9ROSI
MVMETRDCSIEDLELDVTDDDVVIKEGLISRINFSDRVHKSIDDKLAKAIVVRLLDKSIGYTAAGKLDKNAKVTSKGTIVQAKSLLNESNHTSVHVIEDDQGGVLCELNDHFMIGPIRNSGSTGTHHFTAKSFYRQGQHLYKKGMKKGPNKKSITDWAPISLGKVDLADSTNLHHVDSQHSSVVEEIQDKQ